MTATATRRLVTGHGDPDAPATLAGFHDFMAADGTLCDYAAAPDVERLADALIAACPELRFLQEVVIRYVWRRKAQTSQGRQVLGTCKPLTGLPKFALGGGEFIVVLNAEGCRDAHLTAWQQEALIFHELCHIAPADPGDPAARPTGCAHDAELFFAEVRRYGAWQRDLTRAAETFAQIPLVGA